MKSERLEGNRKECPMCGKEFYAMADWAYKLGYEKSRIYFCSWKCLQAKRKTIKKKKAVSVAIVW